MKRCEGLFYLLLAVLFVLLREPFYGIWTGWSPIARLSAVGSSCWNDLAALMLIVVGIPAMVALAGELTETGKRWASVLSGAMLFVTIVFRVCHGEDYIPFAIMPWLRYADVLFPILTALCLATALPKQRRRATAQEGTEELFFYDNEDEMDLMGRDALAEDLCKELIKEKGNEHGAIGVAITGEWGTGKSWLMARLKKKLESKGRVCMEFKPWLYGETNITRQFYLMLERQLRLNGIRSSAIKNAIAEIDNDSAVGVGRVLLSLMGITTHSTGLEKAVDGIKTRLRAEKVQLFVFVDDCDRLAHDELLDVLSLVRNTGDFPHITYVMAFSKSMVKTVLDKEEGLEYVAKMFNLTKELPPIADNVIGDYLCQAIGKNLDWGFNQGNPFSQIAVTRYLHTVREAKKYLNLLVHDYKRLESRFERHYFNEADFCLIELLKYKYPDVYYGLQAKASDYVSFVEKSGWNGPAGLPIKEVFDEESDALKLMSAMFCSVGDTRDPGKVIGIANKDYFPFYFENEPTEKYVEGEDFIKAVDEETLPVKIGEWVDAGYTGVMSLVGAVNMNMSRRYAFECMTAYIWHRCERLQPSNTLAGLTYGYHSDKEKHGFNSIQEVIENTPQIGLMAFQHLSKMDDMDEQDGEDKMKEMINASGRLLELMGIWLSQLKTMTSTDYPYGEVCYYVEAIWHKLLDKAKADEGMTLTMIDVLGACSMEDTFEKMVLPLVIDNPRRWLGATILKVNGIEKEYYLLKSRGIHALFGSLDEMYGEVRKLLEAAKEEDKAYVAEYQRLIYRVAAMTVNKKDPNISDKYKQPDSIEVAAYPALSESVLLGPGAIMPLGAALRQMQKMLFWKGKDIRIHREGLNVFFYPEI